MVQKPSPRVIWSWVALLLAVVIPLTVVHTWLLDRFAPRLSVWYLIATAVALAVMLFLYLPRRRQSLGYALEEGRITATGGVVVTTGRRMELQAVRQVTLLQGPVERRCKTAFVLVSATGGYLLIEGLDQDLAREWCRRMVPR